MSLLDDVLAHNRRFVAETEPGKLGRMPAKKVVVLTCMDTRIVELLEPAMGIKRGDANIIKNVGATMPASDRGVLRSLAVAIHGLGCEEVFVIGHRDCGLEGLDPVGFKQSMIDRGVPYPAIVSLTSDFDGWLGAFDNVEDNVRQVADSLKDNPLIPDDVPVHALVIDPNTGKLDNVEEG